MKQIIIFLLVLLSYCDGRQETEDHQIKSQQHSNHNGHHQQHHQHLQHHPHHHHHHQHSQNQKLPQNNRRNIKSTTERLSSTTTLRPIHRARSALASRAFVPKISENRTGEQYTKINSYYPNNHHDSGYVYDHNRNTWRKTREQHDEVESIGGGGADDWHNKDVESTTTRQTPKIKPTKSIYSEKRVCSHHRLVHVPYHTTEVYQKPIFRQYTETCHGQQLCTGVRLVHEPAYRNVVKHRQVKRVVYTCCSGWEKDSTDSNTCNKPICSTSCKNGGTCTKPDTCTCPNGWTGKYCEIDINECKEEKPCDQSCFNTEGSYYCTCREGFYLHTDKQSCKKVGGFNMDEDAFETRDLESNDLDYEELHTRLDKLERIVSTDKKQITKEITDKYNDAMDTINRLQVRIDTIEHRQTDINKMNNKIKEYDNQSKRIEQLIDLLYKCRSNKSKINCP